MKTKLQLARSFQTSLKFLVGFYTGYKNRTKNHLIDLENAETNKQTVIVMNLGSECTLKGFLTYFHNICNGEYFRNAVFLLGPALRRGRVLKC